MGGKGLPVNWRQSGELKTIRNITKDTEEKETNRVTRKKHMDREED